MEGTGRGMMLVTRPNYDPATRYLYHWAGQLIADAEQRGVTVVDLAGDKARKKEFEGRLQKTSPSLAFLNGHGSPSSVTGQDGETLVDATTNAAILEGLITYAVSCDSAAVLGQTVGAFPRTAYVGFANEFYLLQSHAHLNRPQSDPLARPFMDFSNMVTSSLLKGHSAQESVDRAKQTGVDWINRLLVSSSDPDARASARYLWWNVRHLVCHGDGTMRVSLS